jgi:hypothetical protein
VDPLHSSLVEQIGFPSSYSVAGLPTASKSIPDNLRKHQQGFQQGWCNTESRSLGEHFNTIMGPFTAPFDSLQMHYLFAPIRLCDGNALLTLM